MLGFFFLRFWKKSEEYVRYGERLHENGVKVCLTNYEMKK